MILGLLRLIINLLIKVECRVAGVGLPLLAILASLALINKMWLQLGIFAFLFAAVMMIVFFSAHILFWIEEALMILY